MIMYETQSTEDRGNGPLQGELRSQEFVPVAAVKYMECCLMRFNETDPTWLWLEIQVQERHTPCRVSAIVITQMNPIKSEAEQMERIVAKIGSFKMDSTGCLAV